MASGTGSPCGACKFLRRKCAAGCVFAPYFCSEQGPAQFAAVHRVFGASNASKLLMHVPPPDRCEAAVTLAYEAQARIRDPVYGCVAHIFALQQQVASLQVQLMLAKAELAHKTANYSPSVLEDRDWQGNLATPLPQSYLHGHYSLSPQSSLDCIDHSLDTNSSTEDYLEEHSDLMHPCREEGGQQCDLGELHDLALRMIRN